MEEDDIKKKINYFFENQIQVHILRKDNKFWNGHIIQKENDNVFILEEFKLGKVLLFVVDIHDIRQYMKEGVK